MIKNADRVYYGGDYNPDQWDEATIDEDMRLFKKAGINLVTLPVFSWAKLEPEEGVYDFAWLDKLMDKFLANDIKVCLATPTTAQPAWLSKKYPEVLPVDKQGRKRTHGMRVYFCVNSPKYRERAAAIAEQLAKRYAHYPNLVLWHVANEYGTYCYCPTCEAKFRTWLQKKYGSVENLNEKWHTCFWGRTLTDFDEVYLPTELNDDNRFNPAVNLDYMRFMTDSTIECFENEASILRKYTPNVTIQTNISGHIEKLDQFKMTKHMDIAAWDHYPAPGADPAFVSYKLDLMRGLKDGESFMMQEQSPNQQNWQPYSKLKRPGEVRMLSYQAMAHGADTCLYFQLRQSIAGEEMYHGAVISHAGHENTRMFRECAQIGHELEKIGDAFLGGRTPAETALLFDWDNWWILEFASKRCLLNDDINYLKKTSKFYKALFEKNIPTDIISVETDFAKYKVIYAPFLYMMKPGMKEKIERFVADGGAFVTTTLAGLVDENNRAVFGEYPGALRDLLGIWVEETDALRKEERNRIVMEDPAFFGEAGAAEYASMYQCDIIHSRGAKVLGVYGDDFYAGVPCFTVNTYGKGKAYYIGTEPDAAFLAALTAKLSEDNDITAPYVADAGVELTKRVNDKNEIVFVLNHNKEAAEVDFGADVLFDLITEKEVRGITQISPNDVMVLKKES